MQGPLEPERGRTPQYTQLFFYNFHEATNFCNQRNGQLNPTIFQELLDLLYDVNPFIHIYKHAREVLQDLPDNSANVQTAFNLCIELIVGEGADCRCENLPTADEVAVILPDLPTERYCDIIVHLWRSTEGGFTFVSPNHSCYMPLHYILLFPQGEKSWDKDLTLEDHSHWHHILKLHQHTFYWFHLHVCQQIGQVGENQSQHHP